MKEANHRWGAMFLLHYMNMEFFIGKIWKGYVQGIPSELNGVSAHGVPFLRNLTGCEIGSKLSVE